MKTIKSFITSAFILLLCWTAQAQAPTAQFAGEDKEVMALPDSSQTVEIGLPGSTSEYCYEWTGDDIKTDPHQPVVTVNPKKASNTYRVKRTGACGVEEDEVIVTLKDSVGIVSVKPKKKCYNAGDAIPIEDFEIVTEPTGYESMVTHTPTTAKNKFEWIGTEDTQDITFTLNYNGHISTKVVTVKVFNDDLAASHGQSLALGELISEFQKVKNVVKKGEKVANKLNSLSSAVSPCKPQADLDIDFPNGVSLRSCCNDKEVDGFAINFGSIALGMSVSCDFPTTLSIPILGAGLYITFSMGYGAYVGPANLKYLGEECTTLTIPLGFYANISGGLKLKVPDEDILSASINLVGEAKCSLIWNVGQSIKFHPMDLSVTAVGKVVLLYGLVTEKISYPLFTVSVFN
ncbi:MAG: hypothetical protein J5644_11385 [Bacteroidales bacterium]|nr:hypothetical protein [Bacteroidales bacterium]